MMISLNLMSSVSHFYTKNVIKNISTSLGQGLKVGSVKIPEHNYFLGGLNYPNFVGAPVPSYGYLKNSILLIECNFDIHECS